ncbi:hypothetical protein QJQ45_030286, partial [Haematococcus lacustris]
EGAKKPGQAKSKPPSESGASESDQEPEPQPPAKASKPRNQGMRRGHQDRGRIQANHRQHACFCLADGGADDSFISDSFVSTHKLRLYEYPVALRYEVANNQSVYCTQYVKVHLSIQQFSCFCTLTVMPELVHEYDILLGADWLTVQGALLDYVDKSLTLRTPKGQPTLLPSAVSKKGSVNCTVESLQTVKPVKEALCYSFWIPECLAQRWYLPLCLPKRLLSGSKKEAQVWLHWSLMRTCKTHLVFPLSRLHS